MQGAWADLRDSVPALPPDSSMNGVADSSDTSVSKVALAPYPSRNRSRAPRPRLGGVQPKEFDQNLVICEQLLARFLAREEIAPFLQAMDKKTQGIRDSPVFMQEPIHFGVVQQKLKAGAYCSLEDFARDVRATFRNCQLQAEVNNSLFKTAGRLLNEFEQGLQEIKDICKHYGPEKPTGESGRCSEPRPGLAVAESKSPSKELPPETCDERPPVDTQGGDMEQQHQGSGARQGPCDTKTQVTESGDSDSTRQDGVPDTSTTIPEPKRWMTRAALRKQRALREGVSRSDLLRFQRKRRWARDIGLKQSENIVQNEPPSAEAPDTGRSHKRSRHLSLALQGGQRRITPTFQKPSSAWNPILELQVEFLENGLERDHLAVPWEHDAPGSSGYESREVEYGRKGTICDVPAMPCEDKAQPGLHSHSSSTGLVSAGMQETPAEETASLAKMATTQCQADTEAKEEKEESSSCTGDAQSSLPQRRRSSRLAQNGSLLRSILPWLRETRERDARVKPVKPRLPQERGTVRERRALRIQNGILSQSPCVGLPRPSRFPQLEWAGRMCEGLREDFARSLVGTARGSGLQKLTLGTDCAGAEAPIFALREICKALEKNLGVHLGIHHAFACDVHPASQHFIQRNCSPRVLFPDLLRRTAVSKCLMTGKNHEVPSNLDLYVAGFPCKDFSTLNKYRSGLEGPNMPIFYGVVQYIRRHTPRVFVLENVAGLTMSCKGVAAPIHEVLRILRSIPQYTVRGWKVNSHDYEVPQFRRRVYIIGVHTGKVDILRPMSTWHRPLRKVLAKRSSFPAHAFLLGNHEPEVTAEAARLQARSKPIRSSARMKWVQVHRNARLRFGLAAKKAFTGRGKGWSRFLSDRSREVIDIVAERVAGEFGGDVHQVDKTQRIGEVSQGPEFSIYRDKVTPCVTPMARLWIFSHWRWVIGLEKLALQGFPADSLDLSGLSESDISMLAGNAMTVPVVGAFIVLALAFVRFRD